MRFDFKAQELAGVGMFFRPFTATPIERSFLTYSYRAAELENQKRRIFITTGSSLPCIMPQEKCIFLSAASYNKLKMQMVVGYKSIQSGLKAGYGGESLPVSFVFLLQRRFVTKKMNYSNEKRRKEKNVA